jgi:hypothetical protein
MTVAVKRPPIGSVEAGALSPTDLRLRRRGRRGRIHGSVRAGPVRHHSRSGLSRPGCSRQMSGVATGVEGYRRPSSCHLGVRDGCGRKSNSLTRGDRAVRPMQGLLGGVRSLQRPPPRIVRACRSRACRLGTPPLHERRRCDRSCCGRLQLSPSSSTSRCCGSIRARPRSKLYCSLDCRSSPWRCFVARSERVHLTEPRGLGRATSFPRRPDRRRRGLDKPT